MTENALELADYKIMAKGTWIVMQLNQPIILVCLRDKGTGFRVCMDVLVGNLN